MSYLRYGAYYDEYILAIVAEVRRRDGNLIPRLGSTTVGTRACSVRDQPPASLAAADRSASKDDVGEVPRRRFFKPESIRDFADAMGEITKAAAGHELRFSVRVELGGEKTPPQDVVDSVNEVLSKKVSAKLRLE